MHYYDEIDLLENLPRFEDIHSINRDDDYFYLLLKKDNERINLFMCLESLTQREFSLIACKIIDKIKGVS